MEEVALYKFLGGDPKLLTLVIDNLVLMRVTIDGISTGRGREEVRKEVNYRYL